MLFVPYFLYLVDFGLWKARTSFWTECLLKLKNASMECLCGVKNVFNAYQPDFDLGKDRDPAYIYGPVNPRTVYVGLKFGNLL